jgi:hypothetical protein
MQKMKANTITRRRKVINPMRRTYKYSESSIELAVHTKILKKQKQLNGRSHHIPLNIN